MEPLVGGDAWGKIVAYLQRLVDAETIATWFSGVKCQSADGERIVLTVPSDFHRRWILSNYYDQLRTAVNAAFDREPSIEITIGSTVHAERPMEAVPVASASADKSEPQATAQSAPSFPRLCRLNPKYTFEQYVVGENNRFAHAACRQVADPSSKSFNPLFLYGGVGLGKTHLMHAIGHQILKANPRLKVLYVTSDEFMNSFIESISNGKQFEFRDYYRNVDLLLVDDVQFFSGKERTQIEFFHTFNALYDAGKKIVISSDRPPHELRTLEDRLRNRFSWGLVVDVQPPDLETRIAILRKKAASAGDPDFPLEVAVYIAERVQSDIRELEGVLLRLRTYASVMNQPITVELAKSVLSDVIPPQARRTHDIEQIVQLVCHHMEIRREELLGHSRQKRFATARHIAQYLARKFTNLSYPEIGQYFGGRDHTSVLHAYRRISEQMEKDENMKSLISFLSRQLADGDK